MAYKVKKKRPFRERIAIAISVILMVISLLAVAFVVLWNSKLFQGSNGAIINIGNLGGQTESNGGTKVSGEGQVNFLICGLDESEQMTDIIMLACIDLDKSTVNVLQIPRDTYVKSGVGSTGKINSAYSSGDKSVTPINRLINVINEQYMLRVDHYATITIDSFRNIVDAIGGVPIDMPYAVGNAQLGIIPAGKQVLDGAHAEWLVRHRHTYYDQDIGRMKVLRLFLASALQQVKQIGVKEVTKLLPAIYGEITTDLSAAEAKNFSGLAFSVDMQNISMFILPGEGVTYNGQSVWSTHYYETADMLNAYFRPEGEEVPAEMLKITELAHTGEYYENTQDALDDILDGATPGQKDSSQSAAPAYTHVVTQQKPVTTTAATTTTPAQTTTTAVNAVDELKNYTTTEPSESETTATTWSETTTTASGY